MFIESICRSRQVPKAHLALIHGTQDVKIQSTLNAPNQEINGMNHGECHTRIRL